MNQITVTTAVLNLPLGTGSRPLLQNLGPGDVYFGDSPSVSTANAFKLTPGMGYEFSEPLPYSGSFEQVWVVSNSTADLRYGSVS
jgi:hypothetical protein